MNPTPYWMEMNHPTVSASACYWLPSIRKQQEVRGISEPWDKGTSSNHQLNPEMLAFPTKLS